MGMPVGFILQPISTPVPLVTLDGEKYLVLMNLGCGVSILALVPPKPKKKLKKGELPPPPRLFQFIAIPEGWKPEKVPRWIPSCRSLCGHKFKRWHLGCFTHCTVRQMLKAERTTDLCEITPFMLYRRETYGRFWKLRHLGFKYSVSQAECFCG